MKKPNKTKTTITVSIDTKTAEWLNAKYGGTSKKSWFVDFALKHTIEKVEDGYIILEHEGNQ